MNKALSVFAVIFVLGLSAFVVNSHAEGMATETWNTHEASQLLRCNVRNHDGQFLGRIEDFVVDSNGRIAFAIITQPGVLGIRGKPVAVPFETLTLGSEKNEFVLDMNWEKFASIPKFDQKADLGNRAWATEVYRSFGLEPYWTEE